MKDIILCQYGCGQEALFQTKGGRKICSKSPNQCPINRKKNSQGGKRAYSSGTRNVEKQYNTKKGVCSSQWRLANPEKYAQSLKKAGVTYSQNQKAGLTKNPWTGRKHSLQSKMKISAKAGERNNGLIKTKYFEIYCPYTKQYVKVQGTWQLKYAEYLNQNKINWIRSRKINLKYRLHEDDYLHTYYPDFYLPDVHQYIEIKGYWWKSQDGRVDDSKKMNKVIQQNSDKKIIILQKQQLKWIIDI